MVDIVLWMQSNMLKLNNDKTEFIFFATNKTAYHKDIATINVGNAVIKPTFSVKNLGVIFDSSMAMEKHLNSVCISCFLQLRNISHIRKYLTQSVTKSLVSGLVTSRMDYCNALLYGLPCTILNRLQRVQNTAARIITKTSRYSHITPVLYELHWLPVQYRVQYKILLHTFKALHGKAPPYITDMLQVYHPARTLRSQNSLSLVVPRTRTARYGDRCFHHAAPMLWNNLPPNIREAVSIDSFKRQLKTHFFQAHFINI